MTPASMPSMESLFLQGRVVFKLSFFYKNMPIFVRKNTRDSYELIINPDKYSFVRGFYLFSVDVNTCAVDVFTRGGAKDER